MSVPVPFYVKEYVMFGKRYFSIEQAEALALQLQRQRIRRGDVVRDIEVVGVGYSQTGILNTNLVLAFCPAHIVGIRQVLPANNALDRKLFDLGATWTPDAVEVLSQFPFTVRGFARIVCDITSDQVIHLSNLRVIGITPASKHTIVNQPRMYEAFLGNSA
jgi:hypothetical protein